MTKGLFALVLAGALMVPHVTPALGTDSTAGLGQAPAPQANGGDLQLAPIPHLDALRWLNTGARGPKVDTLPCWILSSTHWGHSCWSRKFRLRLFAGRPGLVTRGRS